MKPTATNELAQLIARLTDGTLTPEEHARLNALLLADPVAQEAYLDHLALDGWLECEFGGELPRIMPQRMPVSRASLSRWFYALPRPAFAAVLMLAGFAMGATAWAVTTRYMARPLTMPLPLVQAGFEADAQPVADGVPTSFGRWSGDFTEVVGAQQGIAPKAGEKMLCFLRSDSTVEPSGAATFVGDMFQLVDLQPYREMLADGAAVVELTASFNALPAAEMTFQTCLWAFSGDPANLPRNWQDSLHEELAYGSGTAHSDTDTHTWQRVTARMIVPAEATLLVMELKVAPSTRPVAPSGPLNFAGVYADEVQLQLRSDGPPATPATPH